MDAEGICCSTFVDGAVNPAVFEAFVGAGAVATLWQHALPGARPL
jgi:hypothetical protein